MRLKHHRHRVCHLDDLTVHEAESLVIIEHRVHVLDPISVDGPIKDDPSSRLVRLHVRAATENATKHAIREFLRDRIVVTIQLRQCNALWIDDVSFDFLFTLCRVSVSTSETSNHSQSFFQNTVSRSLSTIRSSDDHESVSALDHVVELDNLLHKLLLHLQVSLLHDFLGTPLQVLVTWRR